MLSFWVTSRFTMPRPMPSPLALPLALSTILTGLFVIISRFKALTQVVGYLVLENGVYLFGLILAPEVPVPGRDGNPARRLRRGVRDGDRDFPHQS